MTRAVLDPGVLISGIISPRAAPAALLRAWRADAFTLIASPALLRELRVVLLRPKFRRFLSEAQPRGAPARGRRTRRGGRREPTAHEQVTAR